MSIKSPCSKCSLLLMFLFSMSMFSLNAQIVLSERIELPLIDNPFSPPEKYSATGLNSNGVMIYRRVPGQNEDQLELIKADTSLKVNWKGYVSIQKNLKIAHVQYYNGTFSLLFKHQYYLGGDFILVSIRVATGQSSTYQIKNLIPFNSTEFVITPQAAIIGGYFNYRPLALYYNFLTQTSKILPGFLNELGELDQIKTYKDGSIDIIVCAKNLDKKKSLWIRNYTPGGELKKTTILEPGVKKQLMFGRSVKLLNGEQIVGGVYGRFGEYSRGIFVAAIDSAGGYGIKYYNFGDLHNFFSYMKVGRQLRLKDKIERRNEKGKKVKFNYRFLIHDLIPYQDQYIMTGEAFFPHYTYAGNSAYARSRGINSYPVTNFSNIPASYRGDMVFDGYQYTHAVVVGFDRIGKIKWDNSFEINDVKTSQLRQLVEVKPEQDRIVMMYLFQNKLRSKIIRDSEVLEGKTEDPIGPREKSTKRMDDLNEELDYWYGDYFFAYGVQKINYEDAPPGRIFYVNKITYK